MANRETRNAAIARMVSKYINEIGELEVDPDFSALVADVNALASEGRSLNWRTACLKFRKTVDYAEQEFRGQYNGTLPGFNEITFEGRREYCRLFKWALLQGAVYATAGA